MKNRIHNDLLQIQICKNCKEFEQEIKKYIDEQGFYPSVGTELDRIKWIFTCGYELGNGYTDLFDFLCQEFSDGIKDCDKKCQILKKLGIKYNPEI